MTASVQVKNTRYPYKCKVRGLCITVLDGGVSFTESKVHQASAENLTTFPTNLVIILM